MMPRVSPLIASVLLLAACSGNVRKLDAASPAATDFNNALAAEYQAYADSEAEQGRKSDANYYAGKGLKALNGEQVEPEPADAQLTKAREQLVALLNDDVKSVAAQKLAHAQLLFDCWQHQLARHISGEQAPCAEEFKATVEEVQDVADFFVYGKQIDRSITFASRSSVLDEDAQGVIGSIAEKLKDAPDYSIDLNTYSGTGASSRRLAAQRIAAVRRAMEEAGIKPESIHVAREDGSKAVVLSADPVALNARKIDISVKIARPEKTQ